VIIPEDSSGSDKGFTIWLRSDLDDESAFNEAKALSEKLESADLKVQLINASQLAKIAYKRKAGSPALALGLATLCLNSSGIVALVYGSKGPSSQMKWGTLKPKKMLDLDYSSTGNEDRNPSNFDMSQLDLRGWLG
jgi:ferric-dicitrate binding protein FerR (iron transport regulator)